MGGKSESWEYQDLCNRWGPSGRGRQQPELESWDSIPSWEPRAPSWKLRACGHRSHRHEEGCCPPEVVSTPKSHLSGMEKEGRGHSTGCSGSKGRGSATGLQQQLLRLGCGGKERAWRPTDTPRYFPRSSVMPPACPCRAGQLGAASFKPDHPR